MNFIKKRYEEEQELRSIKREAYLKEKKKVAIEQGKLKAHKKPFEDFKL